MTYKEMAFRLFDELSGLYVEDVLRHADLCRRYPKLSNNYVKYLTKSQKKVRLPNDFCDEALKEKSWRRLQEAIQAEKEQCAAETFGDDTG